MRSSQPISCAATRLPVTKAAPASRTIRTRLTVQFTTVGLCHNRRLADRGLCPLSLNVWVEGGTHGVQKLNSADGRSNLCWITHQAFVLQSCLHDRACGGVQHRQRRLAGSTHTLPVTATSEQHLPIHMREPRLYQTGFIFRLRGILRDGLYRQSPKSTESTYASRRT